MMLTPTVDQIQNLIRILAEAEGLDPDILIRQCEAESQFKVTAYNQKSRATGLFQLIPSTAAWLKVNPWKWHECIFGGVKYDGMLYRQFEKDYPKMLAAYNWGPGNLVDCIRRNGALWDLHVPKETHDYIEKIYFQHHV